MVMRSGDYDFGVALATQLAQARDRLTTLLIEAVARELNEVQDRLVIDCGCALERALQGQESNELQELHTEIAELRAELVRCGKSKLAPQPEAVPEPAKGQKIAAEVSALHGEPAAKPSLAQRRVAEYAARMSTGGPGDLRLGTPPAAEPVRLVAAQDAARHQVPDGEAGPLTRPGPAGLPAEEEEENLLWQRAVQESDRRKGILRDARKAAEEKQRRSLVEDQQRRADEMEQKRAEEERERKIEEQKRKEEEEKQQRQAEEEKQKRKAEEEKQQKQVEEENQKRQVEEEKQKRQAEEEKQKRKAEEEKQQRRAEEERQEMKAEEEKQKRKAEEEKQQRRAEEERQKRKAEEEKQKRKAEEEKQQKQAEEESRKRQAVEEKQKRQVEEEKQKRKAEEEKRQRQAEEERQQRQAEEERQKRKAEEEKQKRKAEKQQRQVEEKQKRNAEEQQRRKAEEEAQKRQAEEQQQRRAQEYREKRKAQERRSADDQKEEVEVVYREDAVREGTTGDHRAAGKAKAKVLTAAMAKPENIRAAAAAELVWKRTPEEEADFQARNGKLLGIPAKVEAKAKAKAKAKVEARPPPPPPAAQAPGTCDYKVMAQELKRQCQPVLFDQVYTTEGQLWIVVGGEDTGGLVVRKGESLATERYPVRLSRGTTIEELEIVGNRMHYKRIRGDGPDWGWINVMQRDKPLVVPDDKPDFEP